MWLLIIIAVNVNDPNDIPGWAHVPFPSYAECQEAKSKSISWLKFNKSFQIEMRCEKRS